MTKPISQPRSRISLIALLSVPAALALACGDEIKNEYYYENHYGDGGADAEPGNAGNGGKDPGKAGEPAVEAGSPGEGGSAGVAQGGSAGEGGEPSLIDPRYPDAPVMDTPIPDLMLDIFDTVGNHYWFGVSDEQRQKMNDARWGGGGPVGNGGIYTPGGGSDATYVDHLWVTTAGENPRTTDFGKVQVRVVGQSTSQPWDPQNIPNLNVDADEFVKGQRIDGYEHLRFANGQVSNIFRERLTLELYRRLNYPAPLATFAWVSSNVWGPDISIPYTLVERYKRAFCDRYSEEFGGGCKNMWEFSGGDFAGGGWGGPMPGGGGVFDVPENCQIDECETSRVDEFEALLVETPMADGFKAATADYVDWPSFHRFQCLSYVFSTGDDALHNFNNIVIVERADGKFQYLPYSIDISLGQDWYPYTQLPGDTVLARGCQADTQCWADTIAECEAVIDELVELEPNKLLKQVYDELDGAGMLRAGDQGRYEFLDSWFTDKLAGLPADLERYRDPNVVTCGKGQVDCGGYCDWPENCPGQCIPPGKDPIPLPGGGMIGGAAGAPGDIGAGGGGPIECPMIELYQTQQ
jgi:hypothetical protein